MRKPLLLVALAVSALALRGGADIVKEARGNADLVAPLRQGIVAPTAEELAAVRAVESTKPGTP